MSLGPGVEAAEHIDDVLDSVSLEDARGNRRAVGALAVEDQRLVARHLVEPLLELLQRQVHVALDRARLPLADAANAGGPNAANEGEGEGDELDEDDLGDEFEGGPGGDLPDGGGGGDAGDLGDLLDDLFGGGGG